MSHASPPRPNAIEISATVPDRLFRPDGAPYPVLVLYVDADRRVQFANEAHRIWFGASPARLIGRSLEDLLGREFFARHRASLEAVQSGQTTEIEIEIEIRLPTRDRSIRYAHVMATPTIAPGGAPFGFHALVMDVTERNRHDRFHAGEARVLRKLATGEPLSEVLETLVATIEDQEHGLLASVLLLDESARLRHGAGGRLPAAYMSVIDGLPIGPRVGSCGTAAYTGQAVIVEDIRTDPLWSDYRDLAEAHELRACWSQPIRSSDGRVLGTFAIYARHPRHPGPREQTLIETAADLAGVAIEHRRTEEALRAEQHHLQMLMQNIPDAIFFKDRESRFTRINQAQCRYLDVADPANVIGRDDAEFFTPEAAAAYRADEQRVLETGEPVVGRIEHNGREGADRRWFSTTKAPVRDARGRVTGTVGIAREITSRKLLEDELARTRDELETRVRERTTALTEANALLTAEVAERKRAEGDLRVSEERWRSLAGTAVDHILIVDAEGVIQYLNRAATGHTVEEAIGNTIYDFTAPEYHELQRRALASVIRTGEYETYELIGSGPDRRMTWYRTRMGPYMRGGRIVGATLFATNVTKRRETEQALAESEERFRQLAENISEVFWLSEWPGNQLIYVSPAYARIWGRPAGDLYTHPRDWLEAIHPDDRERVLTALADQTSEQGFDVEFRIRRPDGSERWIRDRGFPIRNHAGDVYRIAGIAEDITDAKLAEEQAKLHQEELARVGRLSSLFVMAASLSHDLSQPLQGIINRAGACEHEIRKSQSDQAVVLDDLAQILEQGRRAAEIVRGVRQFVRREQATVTDVDVNTLVQETMRLVGPPARQSEVRMRTCLAPDLPPCAADRIQLLQVLLNLSHNAIEAMRATPPDERELTVTTTRADPDTLEITVGDTGPGLGPDVADRVFDAFYTTKTDGMGLGLALARHIIEAHDGTLKVRLPRSRGALFVIALRVHSG